MLNLIINTYMKKNLFFLLTAALCFFACSEDDAVTPPPSIKGTTPRYLTAHDGKVYVTLFSGAVARIDTLSLDVEATVAVGRNPEQIAVSGGRLFVANSGGLDWNTEVGYDKSVSVIDIASFTEEKKIPVVINPAEIIAADDALYLISSGNYVDVPAALQKIDAASGEVTTLPQTMSTMCYLGGRIYGMLSVYEVYDGAWIPTISYSSYDVAIGEFASPWITDGTQLASPYKLFQAGNYVAVSESDYVNDGTVNLFSPDGVKVASFVAGISPRKGAAVGDFMFVLNEGLSGYNNSSLTKFDVAAGAVVDKEYFKAVNGFAIGDTANDILLYGGKMYIAVATDNIIWVTDLDAKVIDKILF